ncbi:hypothetical protein [Zavarzinia sp. CC-PAN008]|uniref:hypothetical protein n=1 Tax=Zavarzinia sp. CC-PAN008 TaxID=3243332 RepID=UPI003F742E3F
MRVPSAAAAVLVMSCLHALPVQAQSRDEFIQAFAGEWRVVDARFAAPDSPCLLSLSREPRDDAYAVAQTGCKAELANVRQWNIANSRMVLGDGTAPVVTLGGTQRRMSGTSSDGTPFVLERTMPGDVDSLAAARQAYGCYFEGFTSQCAPADAVQAPTPQGDGTSRVKVLVNLNVRVEARGDSDILGVVPADSCVVVDACVTTTDGAWCRAGFGDKQGWLRKLALRRDTWPVVTYANSCPG